MVEGLENETYTAEDPEVSTKNYNYKRIILIVLSIISSAVILTTSYFMLFLHPADRQITSAAFLEIDESLQTNLEEPHKQQSQVLDFDTELINAEAVYVFNPVTDQIYISSNINEKVKIASITKLMTAMVVYDQFTMDEEIIITEAIVDKFPEDLSWKLGLEVGDIITIETLLNAILISSYNDAAITLAEIYPGKSEGFIIEMNRRAEAIGMLDTNFVNPNGYDADDAYSTARDVKRMVMIYLKYPELVEISGKTTETLIFSQVDEIIVEHTIYTTNSLLGSSEIIKGLKTGYTEGAGECLVAYFDAGESDQLVTIVLDSGEDKFDLTDDLLDIVQDAFE